jgi:Mitochondrial biogenesis AIM24
MRNCRAFADSIPAMIARRLNSRALWSFAESTSSIPLPRSAPIGRRYLVINATPSTAAPHVTVEAQASPNTTPLTGADSTGMIRNLRAEELADKDIIDARFEILGSPFSLLSVSLSASQHLYTRRGTLVGVSGKAENVCMNL